MVLFHSQHPNGEEDKSSLHGERLVQNKGVAVDEHDSEKYNTGSSIVSVKFSNERKDPSFTVHEVVLGSMGPYGDGAPVFKLCSVPESTV